MVEYLDTQNIGGKISSIIKSAKKELIIISPFLQVSPIYRDYIKGVANHRGQDLRIKIISRKIDDNKEKEWIDEIDNIDLRYKDNLHAKCYMNETAAVITSMNLYGYSEQNNYEMGVLITKETDKQTFEKLYEDVEFLSRNSILINGVKEEKKEEVKLPEKKELKLSLEEQKGFVILKDWRYLKAKELRQPAYSILKDDEIKDIVTNQINKREDLRQIKGIADAKINKFGNEIIDVLKECSRYVLAKVVNTYIQYDELEGYDRIKVKYLSNDKEEWLDTTRELPENNKIVAVKVNKNWFNDYFYLEE